ncbi:MAG: hypothetical protein J3K34DRAFT_408852 [Monoraphidium minutum]|nr:MAG: hypothetical protein J3K34DRAFT_408852 [Monoraphidium minutum]
MGLHSWGLGVRGALSCATTSAMPSSAPVVGGADTASVILGLMGLMGALGLLGAAARVNRLRSLGAVFLALGSGAPATSRVTLTWQSSSPAARLSVTRRSLGLEGLAAAARAWRGAGVLCPAGGLTGPACASAPLAGLRMDAYGVMPSMGALASAAVSFLAGAARARAPPRARPRAATLPQAALAPAMALA